MRPAAVVAISLVAVARVATLNPRESELNTLHKR